MQFLTLVVLIRIGLAVAPALLFSTCSFLLGEKKCNDNRTTDKTSSTYVTKAILRGQVHPSPSLLP